MADIERDLDAVPTEGGERIYSIPHRDIPARHTESLGEALARTIGDLGFAPRDEITPAALEIGIALRRERLAKGLTQVDVARQVGISQAMLSAIENGKGRDGPTYATIRNLGEALGLELALRPVSTDEAVNPGTLLATKLPEAVTEFVAPADLEGVRVTSLGEEGVDFVRGLVTRAAVAGLKALLKDSSLLRKGAKRIPEARLWNVEPHAATVIDAPSPLVLLTFDSDAMRIRPVHGRVKRKSFYQAEDLTFIGAHGKVELANVGEASSMVFSVPAAEFFQAHDVLGE